MDKSAVAVIGIGAGVVAVAAVAAMILASASSPGSQSSGCTSSSQCQPGYVCSGGECLPQGSGECTPPASGCGCSAVWDSVLCECSDLIPARINLPLSPAVLPQMGWILKVEKNLIGETQAVVGCANPSIESCPGCGITSCPVCTGMPPGYSGILITGSVTDSSGKGICNQIVSLELSAYSLDWTTADGAFSGTFQLFLSPDNTNYFQEEIKLVTGSSGDFQAYMGVTISQVRFTGGTVNGNPQGISPENYTVSLYASVGSSVSSETLLEMPMLMCDYSQILVT